VALGKNNAWADGHRAGDDAVIAFAAALCVVAAFGVLSYRLLRSSAYSRRQSVLCAALTGGQMLAALTTATVPALLLAFTVYLIAAGAAAFARLQNVRNVMVLSGALALVQGVNPIGTVMAATLVPVLIGLQNAEMFRARGMSLLVLLLFIPVSTAMFLTYFAHTAHALPSAWLVADIAQVEAHNLHLWLGDLWLRGLLCAAELMLIALPVWVAAGVVRNRVSITIATVCAALIVAVTVSVFLGRMRPVALVAPALAMPSILVQREWPSTRIGARWIAVGPAFGAFLTWLFVALAM
jgi:hypothetical protein